MLNEIMEKIIASFKKPVAVVLHKCSAVDVGGEPQFTFVGLIMRTGDMCEVLMSGADEHGELRVAGHISSSKFKVLNQEYIVGCIDDYKNKTGIFAKKSTIAEPPEPGRYHSDCCFN